MRLIGQIILLCLAIAALQVILSLIAVAIVLLLLWGLIFRTQATLGLLLFALFLGFAATHPFVFAALLLTVLGIKFMASRRKQ